MKKIRNILGISLIAVALFSCESDGGDSVIDFEVGAVPDFNIVSGSVESIDFAGIDDVNLEFTVDVPQGNPESFDLMGFYTTVDGTLYGPGTFATNVTTFPATFSISAADIIAAFPELNSTADIQIEDRLLFYSNFTFADGRVVKILNDDGTPNYGSDIASSSVYSVTLEYVVACPPQPGTYIIDMHDSYGDGWQTNDGDAGDGLMLLLDGVLAFEVGLCSPYNNSQADFCTPNDGFEGSTTITIPEGTESASWVFPGDAYGEISFEIYQPNGDLVFSYTAGDTVTGELPFLVCAE